LLVGTCLGLFFIYLVLWNFGLARYLVSDLHMNDFGKVYYSSQAFLDGSRPMYGPNQATLIKIGEHQNKEFWNLNPPHFHFLIIPLTLFSPTTALIWWFFLNLACLVTSLVVIARELDYRFHFTRPLLSQAFLFLTGLLLFSGTGMVLITGQFSFVLMLLLTLAWKSARRDNWRVAGLYLGVLVALKLFLALFFPYLLVRKKWGGLAVAVLAAAVLYGLGYLYFGRELYQSWSTCIKAVDWEWASMNASVAGVIKRAFLASPYYAPFVESPAAAHLLALVCSAAIVLATLISIYRDGSPGGTDRHFLGLLLASLLASPLGWVYYLWLVGGPLAAVINSFDRRRIGSSSRMSRMATLLFVGSLLGFAVPFNILAVADPTPLYTVTGGSVYFWSLLALWIANLAIIPKAQPDAALQAST